LPSQMIVTCFNDYIFQWRHQYCIWTREFVDNLARKLCNDGINITFIYGEFPSIG